MTTNLYGLQGKLSAQPGKGEELAKILIEASVLMKSAKGCHLYIVGVDRSNPDDVLVTEVWDSVEDHDASLSLEGVKELITQAIPILAGPPQKGKQLDVLGGFGI